MGGGAMMAKMEAMMSGMGGGGSWGQDGGDYGNNDWGESREAGYTDLGAGLEDVDWSNHELETKGHVSEEYMHVAGARSKLDVDQWRKENSLTVSGRDVANPIMTFEETGFPTYMLNSFKRQGFKKPSVIQSQGWGPAMAGRDVVGIAKTGSGKTLAFGIPGLLHISAQPPLRPGDGPLMLVLAPTRELAQQIEEEFRKVLPENVRAVCVYGGAPKRDQAWHLRTGVEAIIATPGRLIDFLQGGQTNLRRVTYLVLDEADRMLDMGFEPDMRKIVGQIRPDRQTLLWSATWPKAVQRLASDFTKDIVKIMVGSDELTTNKDIKQLIIMTAGFGKKMDTLRNTLWRLDQQGACKVLVFCGTKAGCDSLCDELRQEGFECAAIHKNKEQPARERALSNLKNKRRFILVATDVAQRGLDIPHLPAVINFDFPENLEDYVHRIGRTGRAGNKGEAITFFSPQKDCGHAKGLIALLNKAGQPYPPQLEECTQMAPPPSRGPWGGNKKGGGGGGGGKGGGGFGKCGGGKGGGGFGFGGGGGKGKGKGGKGFSPY